MTSRRRVLAFLSLALATAVLPVSPAEAAATAIDACGIVVGKVVVANDLTSPPSTTCLVVAQAKTSIDLNGKTITGGGGPGSGIHNPGFEKVRVVGPGVITNFDSGIFFEAGSDGAKIMKGVEAHSNNFGIVVDGARAQVKGNSVHDNATTGIDIDSAMGTIQGNLVTLNGVHGIVGEGDGVRVLKNDISQSGQIGVLIGPAGPNFKVVGNTCVGNGTNTAASTEGRSGIRTHPSAGTDGKIVGNTVTNNGGWGVSTFAGVTAKNNDAAGNNGGSAFQQCDPSEACDPA